MSGSTELLAAVRYLEDLEWRAEEAHYQTAGNDHPANGRVYGIREVLRALRDRIAAGADDGREAIVRLASVHLSRAEAEYAQTIEPVGREVEGRVAVLLEIRNALRDGGHVALAPAVIISA